MEEVRANEIYQIDEYEYDSDSSSNESDSSSNESDSSSNMATENDKSKTKSPTIIAGKEFTGSESFIYSENVKVTVKDCKFHGPVKFVFHKDASIKFEGTTCSESAFIEGFGKIETEFEDCNFSRILVISHKAKEINENDIVLVLVTMLLAAILFMEFKFRTFSAQFQELNKIENIAQFEFNKQIYLDSKTYTFDEKVDLTVRGSTFMRDANFIFRDHANLTFTGNTCMGSITFESHGLFNAKFQENKFTPEDKRLLEAMGYEI